MIDKIKTSDLAKFLNVTPGFVSQIKSGKRKLPIKHCRKVSAQYNISLHDLRPDVY